MICTLFAKPLPSLVMSCRVDRLGHFRRYGGCRSDEPLVCAMICSRSITRTRSCFLVSWWRKPPHSNGDQAATLFQLPSSFYGAASARPAEAAVQSGNRHCRTEAAPGASPNGRTEHARALSQLARVEKVC